MDVADATFLAEGFWVRMSSEELLVLRMLQIERWPEDLARAAQALQKTRFASKGEFEKKCSKRMRRESYKPRELVMVWNSEVEMSLNRKSKPRYLGLFKVVWRTRGGSYVLRELDGNVLWEGVAAFWLFPYISWYNVKELRRIAEEGLDEEDSSMESNWDTESSEGDFWESEEE